MTDYEKNKVLKRKLSEANQQIRRLEHEKSDMLDIMRRVRDIFKTFRDNRAYEYLVHSIQQLEKTK